MLASESCRNCHFRLLKRCWFLLLFLPLTIAIIVLNVETFADEPNPGSASSLNTQSSKSSKPGQTAENTAEKRSESPANNTDAAKTEKKAPSAKDNSDEQNAPDPFEMLNAIRKKNAKKYNIDNSKDDLILSQSSANVFLNRKKIRDITDNNLDHWYLSSFEDDFNLTLIEFEAIPVRPVVIDFDLDLDSAIAINKNDCPVLNAADVALFLNAYINYPIPESVMEYLSENCDESIEEPPQKFLIETFSSYNYVVLFLAILGFSILAYVIYRIVVWAFLLDQDPDYDLQNGRDEDVVAPVDMNVYSAYFYQINPEDKH